MTSDSSGRESGTPGTDGDLTFDQIFDVLGHEPRRHALSALRERDGPVEFDEIVQEIRRRCADDPTRRRVETALSHAHLPKLDCAGIVRYDADGATVELTDAATQLAPFLELTEE